MLLDSGLQLQTQLGISNASDWIPEIISFMSTIYHILTSVMKVQWGTPNKKWVDLKGTFRKLKTDCAEKVKLGIICSIKSKNGLLIKPGHKQK